jgi:hypothetical protein
MQQKRSTRIRLALAGVLTLASAFGLAADGPRPAAARPAACPDGPGPPSAASPSSPAAGDAAAERAAVIRDVTGSEDTWSSTVLPLTGPSWTSSRSRCSASPRVPWSR